MHGIEGHNTTIENVILRSDIQASDLLGFIESFDCFIINVKASYVFIRI